MQFDFCAVCHRFIDVLVLAEERERVEDSEVNLAAEKVVVVRGGKIVLAVQKILLDASFEGTILFGFQIGIWQDATRQIGKGLLETRRFDSSCIREPKASSREILSSFQDLHRQRNPGNHFIAKGSVVDKAGAGNRGKPAEGEHFL